MDAEGVGCGKLFCNEHLVGHAGPSFCGPCWARRKIEARERIVDPESRKAMLSGKAREGIRHLIALADPEPGREGLTDTPRRVVKAFIEMTRGYREDPEVILSTQFDAPHDEIVIVRRIDFVSLCEHHLLPFSGWATVGYLPGEKVVGLSKLARLVDCFARRLQIQERLTDQVAKALEKGASAKGVGVIVEATHACMTCRGVGKPEATMVTSAMLGVFRTEPAARSEFMALARAR